MLGLKKAIDEGVVQGPRILGSGPVISQTSGHGDFEITDQYLGDVLPGAPSKQELFGWSNLADGVPEVTKAARLALRTGASQIKVMVGGGVSSPYDPLDASQYSLDELRAIVAEATNWGTYVSVHAFTDYVVNAGGAIYVRIQRENPQAALADLMQGAEEIYATLLHILKESEQRHQPTHRVADQIADEWLSAEKIRQRSP